MHQILAADHTRSDHQTKQIGTFDSPGVMMMQSLQQYYSSVVTSSLMLTATLMLSLCWCAAAASWSPSAASWSPSELYECPKLIRAEAGKHPKMAPQMQKKSSRTGGRSDRYRRLLVIPKTMTNDIFPNSFLALISFSFLPVLISFPIVLISLR